MGNARNPNSNPRPSESGKYLDQATWNALKASGFTEGELYEDHPTGPIIFAYSRKQAIEDGVLVDLMQPGFRRIVVQSGVRVHAAMTATCFAAVITDKLTPDSAWGALCRLAAMLTRFRDTVRKQRALDSNTVHFTMEGVDGQPVAMYSHIGPGDRGEPVLTFMLEGED